MNDEGKIDVNNPNDPNSKVSPCKIPRKKSKQENKISQYLINFSKIQPGKWIFQLKKKSLS
jgi:hypothetical protein